MKLHTVFITYNRLELTKQAIQSYLDTVTVPFSAMVVDNHSEDGTLEWLQQELPEPISFWHASSNGYPGAACNFGWITTPQWATHLHRADNDFKFLPGWCDEVQTRFNANLRLGQLGLRTDEEELHNAHNVGGNCVIRRQLWDDGLRWDERPWPKIKTPGYTEDSFFSPEVERMGWTWARVEKPCIQPLSYEDPNDPYYRKTWRDRGINL